MKLYAALFVAASLAYPVGRAATWTPITSLQYDSLAQNYVWQADGLVAPPPGGGQMALTTGSITSVASFDFHETEDSTSIMLSFDPPSRLLTYSAVGHFGNESTDIEAPQATHLAVRLSANALTDPNGAIRLVNFVVDGSGVGDFSATQSAPFAAFLVDASPGIELVTFSSFWIGSDPTALSFQVLGLRDVPEPSTVALVLSGFGLFALKRTLLGPNQR